MFETNGKKSVDLIRSQTHRPILRSVVRRVEALAMTTVLGFVLVAPVFAGGETAAQLAARYGKPVSESEDSIGLPERIYRKAGVEVTAVFIDGRAMSLQMRKLNHEGFSAEEFRAIARAEGLSTQSLRPGDNVWRARSLKARDPEQPTAAYDRASKAIKVTTYAYAKLTSDVRRKIAEAEARKRTGF